MRLPGLEPRTNGLKVRPKEQLPILDGRNPKVATLEAGSEICGAKPSRFGDRPTVDAEHEVAVREFIRDAANVTARAKARLADGGK